MKKKKNWLSGRSDVIVILIHVQQLMTCCVQKKESSGTSFLAMLRKNFLSYYTAFFFSSRRRHTRWTGDWSSDVCSSDLRLGPSGSRRAARGAGPPHPR